MCWFLCLVLYGGCKGPSELELWRGHQAQFGSSARKIQLLPLVAVMGNCWQISTESESLQCDVMHFIRQTKQLLPLKLGYSNNDIYIYVRVRICVFFDRFNKIHLHSMKSSLKDVNPIITLCFSLISAIWKLEAQPAWQLLHFWRGLCRDDMARGRPVEWCSMQLPPHLHLQEGHR